MPLISCRVSIGSALPWLGAEAGRFDRILLLHSGFGCGLTARIEGEPT
jgi:hypothetical protein